MQRSGIRQTRTGKFVIDGPTEFVGELLKSIPGYGPGAVLRVDSAGEPFFDGASEALHTAAIDYSDGSLVVDGVKVDDDGNPIEEPEPQEPVSEQSAPAPSDDITPEEIVAESEAEPVSGTATGVTPPNPPAAGAAAVPIELEVVPETEAPAAEPTPEPAPAAPGKVQHRGSKSSR